MRANPARRRSTPGALFRRRSSQQQPHSPQHHALSGLADHGPPSPVGSVLLSPREGSAPWMLAFRDEASGLGIGTSPLSAALQVEVASAVAPPVVGGGAKVCSWERGRVCDVGKARCLLQPGWLGRRHPGVQLEGGGKSVVWWKQGDF